jgi:uncharacterized membrane protein SirB2
MTLAEWYPSLKQAHVSLVAGSGALFAVRGAAALAGQGWPTRAPWRRLSVVIDTLLLVAGVTLWALLALNPLRDVWLGTKFALLLVYIVLGSFALRRGPTLQVRAASHAAALATFAFMVGVALNHHPLGFLATRT